MGQMKVRDIMTTQVVTLSKENTLKDAIIKFAVDNMSGAPVVDDNYRLIGILSEVDILETVMKIEKRHGLEDKHILNVRLDDNISDKNLADAIKEFSETKVGDVMSRTILTTSPDSPIEEVVKSMLTMDVNRFPVMEKGVLVGIVTRGDIIFAMYKKKRR